MTAKKDRTEESGVREFKKEVSALALHVQWQTGIEKCEVIRLDSDQKRQRKLLKVIRGKKTVVAQPAKKVRTKYVEEMYQQRQARKREGKYAL